MDRITVAIAAHDGSQMTAVCDTLRHDANIAVFRRVEAGEGLVAQTLRLKPRILLLSVELCGDAECALLHALRRECPETLVLVLVHHSVRDDQLANAVAVGARGYLEQDDIERLLANAVHRVDRGEAWVPRKMLGKIMTMAFS